MYIPRRMIAVQGHPEFNGFIMREMLARRYEMGLFDAATLQDAMLRADDAHDGVHIAGVFLRFLRDQL